jgi:secreted trypsin-like serine protease
MLLLAACVTQPDELAQVEQAIVGGTQAATTEFPTVVGLLHGTGNWFCTGVLVDKDWVLTAASCFDDTSATQVRLDDATIADGGGKTVNVSEIHMHPSWNINSTTWSHDIALLKLATSVTDRTPSLIRRDTSGTGTAVIQAGFGVNNNNGGGGGTLRSLATTSVDCGLAGDSGISNLNLMCFNASDGTGSCYGDGGGPAFVGSGATRAVTGIASGGTSSSCTSGLDVYTAVAAELTFIDSKLPTTLPPPPGPEPEPDTTNPDQPADEDPVDDDDAETTDRPPVARGCSTGGETGGLIAIAFGLLALRRRPLRR